MRVSATHLPNKISIEPMATVIYLNVKLAGGWTDFVTLNSPPRKNIKVFPKKKFPPKLNG